MKEHVVPPVELSVVVPAYNETASIAVFHQQLVAILESTCPDYEIIYCDDGSADNTAQIISSFGKHNPRVRLVKLSRNFGKELALTAGIAHASGSAVLTMDADGQHPVNMIPKFVAAWREGAQVVEGVWRPYNRRGVGRRLGTRIFYASYRLLTGLDHREGSSDFRLMDRAVCQEFLRFSEPDRITRGLIDWLGFRRVVLQFEVAPRIGGQANYSMQKLAQLAGYSMVSMSPRPLYAIGVVGVLFVLGSFVLGFSVLIEQVLLGDPWHWKFTGTAMLSILLLFMVGILMVAQGILAMYISHIHSQTKRRPLYVVDYGDSVGVSRPTSSGHGA